MTTEELRKQRQQAQQAIRETLAPLAPRAVASARQAADWLLACQLPEDDGRPESGDYYWNTVVAKDLHVYACNWNLAFAIMGLFAAFQEFGDERYRDGALRMVRYLKTLQIFDPFHPDDYGAFREMTPQTPWCYVRDALSAAWAMLETYRFTGEAEYLERAQLWYRWFRKRGMDEQGWPLWGRQFDPPFPNQRPAERPELHGVFHGGSLNFFHLLYRTTGDKACVGEFYEKIADRFVTEIQQPDGFFRTTLAATGKVPEEDPQNGLHRGNDDLGTLGLAGAYQLFGKPEYAHSIHRFLTAVFARQQPDGSFEPSCAANPVILNAVYESAGMPEPPVLAPDALARCLEYLFARQIDNPAIPLVHGSFDEHRNGDSCGRSTCYALIVLLKIFGRKHPDFLSIGD